MNLFRLFIFLPLVIQKVPYFFALFMVRLVYIDQPIKIWPRNSFILNTLICALSDLDLTFYAYKPCDIYSQLWRYKLLKVFLPFLGEINFYHKNKLSSFLDYANTFELQRDPILVKTLGGSPKFKSDYEKIVFFLKILESDRRNLKSIPKFREKKWRLHFEQLGWEFPSVLGHESLQKILNNKLVQKDIKSKVFLKCFFDLPSRTKKDLNSIYEECSRRGLIKDYILFYPFYWIGSSFYHDSFEHDLELVKDLTENESLLLLSQVRWELWGLFTQIEVIPDKGTLLMHLENIRRLVNNIQQEELQKDTLAAISLLSNLVEATLESYKA